jgi:hypothetical protein
MAGYSINRIPLAQKVFIPDVPSLWGFSGSSSEFNSSLVEKYNKEGSLQASMQVGQSIFYNTDEFTINGTSSITSTLSGDVGDTITAFVWAKSDKPVIVDFSVHILYPAGVPASSSAASGSKSISISSGEWTLLRLYELPLVSDDSYQYPLGFKIELEDIEGGTSAQINFTHPVIYGTLDFTRNPAINQIMSRFPEFILDEDFKQEPLPYQFIRFIEMSTIHMGEMVGLLDSFIYQDISEGKDPLAPATLSTLVDPTVASRDYLFWLSQFSGTQIINPKTGFTPWVNLPEDWQGIDLIDGEDTSEDGAPWGAIQEFNTEPAGLEEFLRWQVSTASYGMKAGTKEAIINSVKRVLLGTKTVTYEVMEPFNWTVKITTLKSETPDATLLDAGDTVLKILELIEPARPLGLRVLHELA